MNHEEKLLKEKAELEAQLKKMPEVPNLGDETGGELLEEEADETEEYATNLGIKDALKKRLAEINSELEKLRRDQL